MAVKAITFDFWRTLFKDDRVQERHDAQRETLADYFATAILEYPPEPIDGALEAVHAAADLLPIGIVSDSGISPGTSLRALLDRFGMLERFTALTFSDELGVAKPRREMYEHAAEGLNVRLRDMLHIGDLEPTDIKGALDIGAQAALFAGDNDRFAENTKAQYTFLSWQDFIDALPRLV